MKRLAGVLIAIIVLASFPAQAEVAYKNYDLPEIPLEVSLPERLLAVTRGEALREEGNGDFLEAIEAGPAVLKELFLQNNIYLNAIEKGRQYELVVTMLDYDGSREIWDFNLFPETEIIKMGGLVQSQYEMMGFTGMKISQEGVYKTGGAVFLVLNLDNSYSENIRAYGRQYYTVYNGRALNLTLHSYEGPLTDELRFLALDAVNHLKFPPRQANPADEARVKNAIGGAVKGGIIGALIGALIGAAGYFLKKKRKNKKA